MGILVRREDAKVVTCSEGIFTEVKAINTLANPILVSVRFCTMSVAVLCNLSDGVIIGVDSALTVMGTNGVERVFEDGGNLFQIGKKLGVATFGLAGLGGRSIGSFLHEFEGTHPELEVMPIPQAVESLRDFFVTKVRVE
jgi:hypothetical protein